jgi:aminopeptidase N
MPIDILVNGAKKRIFPNKNFQSIDIKKHASIEVMDWKFYVKPVNYSTR